MNFVQGEHLFQIEEGLGWLFLYNYLIEIKRNMGQRTTRQQPYNKQTAKLVQDHRTAFNNEQNSHCTASSLRPPMNERCIHSSNNTKSDKQPSNKDSSQIVGPLGGALDSVFDSQVIENELYRHRRRDVNRDVNVEKLLSYLKDEALFTETPHRAHRAFRTSFITKIQSSLGNIWER
jgi:hypothetical protein